MRIDEEAKRRRDERTKSYRVVRSQRSVDGWESPKTEWRGVGAPFCWRERGRGSGAMGIRTPDLLNAISRRFTKSRAKVHTLDGQGIFTILEIDPFSVLAVTIWHR